VIKKNLLNTTMIFATGGHRVVSAFHEADDPLIDPKRLSKGSLSKTSQRTSRSQLAPCFEMRFRHELPSAIAAPKMA
jgi:hypothetical protein